MEKSPHGINYTILLPWLNWLVKQSAEVKNLEQVVEVSDLKTSQAYAVALNVLAPDVFTKHDMLKCFNNLDLAKRAEQIVKVINAMGINVIMEVQDIIEARQWANMTVLGALFVRWCNTYAAACTNIPPLVKDTYNDIMAAHSGPSTDANIDEQEQRMEALTRQTCQWQRLGSLMQSSIYSLLAVELRGESVAMSAQEEKDMAQYTQLDHAKVYDLLPTSMLESVEMLRQIQQVLVTHYPTLRKVYKYYSTADSVASTVATTDNVMSNQEFMRFCTDCKIPDKKKCTKDTIKHIFEIANKATPPSADVKGKSEPDLGVFNPDEELIPLEFSECLLRIACAKFDKGPPPHRLEELIVECVQPNAAESVVDGFKAEVYKGPVQGVFKTHRDTMLKIFKYYASNGGMDKSGANDISLPEFTSLIRDCNLVDSVFTHMHVKQIFVRIQDDDDPDLKMFYHEFQEALAAIAAFKSPLPFNPLAMRLNDFIVTKLVPPLKQKLGLKGAAAK